METEISFDRTSDVSLDSNFDLGEMTKRQEKYLSVRYLFIRYLIWKCCFGCHCK